MPARRETGSVSVEARIRSLVARLEAIHGRPEPPAPRPCLDVLIACILSQHTSDANSGKAWRRLRSRFPRWDDVLGTPTEDIEDAIRVGGLAASKARAIKAMLQRVMELEGELSLDRLRAISDADARDSLLRLPGVGPKTAAIVLCFAMGRPFVPVDTHVHRVARRLGLIPPTMNADRAHEALRAAVPSDLAYSFHIALIRHGRRVCRARHAQCGTCAISDECERPDL